MSKVAFMMILIPQYQIVRKNKNKDDSVIFCCHNIY